MITEAKIDQHEEIIMNRYYNDKVDSIAVNNVFDYFTH